MSKWVLLLLVLLLVAAGAMYVPMLRSVPACAEDVTLIGAGEFSDGRWEYYVCGPAVDDFVTD